MPELAQIVKGIRLTEKGTRIEKLHQYVLQVACDANKLQIKQAVEQLLGAKVASVRTSIAHGKVKRQGRYAGRRSDWKKAFVQLRDGEKMPEFLEGA